MYQQNVSMVNTVLATITAKAFKEFADAIEKVNKQLLHNYYYYYYYYYYKYYYYYYYYITKVLSYRA